MSRTVLEIPCGRRVSVEAAAVALWIRGHGPLAPMTRPADAGNRIPAVAGILYIVVSLVAVFFEFDGPDVLDTPGEVVRNFRDDRSSVLTASTLFCVASVCYLAFLVGLVAVLRRLEAGRTNALPISGFVMAMGSLGIGVFMTFVMIYGSLATSIVGDASPETVLALLRMGNALDALSGFFQGLLMVAASAGLMVAGLLPRWLNWWGLVGGACYVVGVVTFGTDGFWPVLGAIAAFGLLFHVVWMVALNICLLLRARTGPDPHAA